jgi:hypothetical protein
LVAWLLFDVLRDDRLSASMSQMEAESREESVAQMRFLLEDDKRFNLLCSYIFDGVGDARVESFTLPKDQIPRTLVSLLPNSSHSTAKFQSNPCGVSVRREPIS